PTNAGQGTNLSRLDDRGTDSQSSSLVNWGSVPWSADDTIFWISGQALSPRSMKHLLRLFAVLVQPPVAIWQSLNVCRLPIHFGQ
ncbi:hypothetical protein, partial [Acidovorax sp.]|uniref:hypothetical protein n=1 Tax=Acidovorax sp. TaxID=1872122 RepID=UPI0025C6EBE8